MSYDLSYTAFFSLVGLILFVGSASKIDAAKIK